MRSGAVVTRIAGPGVERQPIGIVQRVLGLDHGAFGIGDEFTCKCGSIVGVIQSISGDDALISWACRGKFVVPIEDLLHVEHEG
jgi:hypothetical protein